MIDYETIKLEVNERGVARLTLNRPDARNAMSQQLIRDLTAARGVLDTDSQVRVVVLTGAGKVFCAGGDLRGFQQQAVSTREGRIHDATEFAKTLAALNDLSKPVIGRINGPAYGGGLGLMSICDLCIGVSTARFRLTEVTLGLIPATISPHVIARIGIPNARRVMLNAHEIDADEAVRIGLLQAVVEPEALDAAVDREVDKFLKCAPGAVANCKRLIRFVSTHAIAENIDYTAEALADAWESAEIKEGVDAFLNKRKPNWDVSAG
jgi:methylglutaconyl-CoA hydratase